MAGRADSSPARRYAWCGRVDPVAPARTRYRRRIPRNGPLGPVGRGPMAVYDDLDVELQGGGIAKRLLGVKVRIVDGRHREKELVAVPRRHDERWTSVRRQQQSYAGGRLRPAHAFELGAGQSDPDHPRTQLLHTVYRHVTEPRRLTPGPRNRFPLRGVHTSSIAASRPQRDRRGSRWVAGSSVVRWPGPLLAFASASREPPVRGKGRAHLSV